MKNEYELTFRWLDGPYGETLFGDEATYKNGELHGNAFTEAEIFWEWSNTAKIVRVYHDDKLILSVVHLGGQVKIDVKPFIDDAIEKYEADQPYSKQVIIENEDSS